MFERHGFSARRIAVELGVNLTTVTRWIKRYDWQAPAGPQRQRVPSETELQEQARRRHELSEKAKQTWAIRRAAEANEVGRDAEAVRAKIMELVEVGKASDARALATVYGIFVDKATLLSGEFIAVGRRDDRPQAEDGPSDARAMAEAGRQRALKLVQR